MLLTLTLALAAFASSASTPTRMKPDDVDIDLSLLRTGDVILQTSTSSQSPAIVVATASPYSHAAIVVVEGGKAFVVEAAGSVRKTPLQTFLQRGVDGRFTVLRHHDVDDAAGMRIARQANKRVGTRYDASFKRGNDALYCSELVATAFHDAGVDVGPWQKVSELHVDNPVVGALFEKRWRKHPACKGQQSSVACMAKLKDTEVITPAGLRDNDAFDVVVSTFPIGLR